jgi:hypothetical protein
LAPTVSWSSPEDCAALTRLVRKARRDAFEVGRTAGRAEVEAARHSQLRGNPAHLA